MPFAHAAFWTQQGPPAPQGAGASVWWPEPFVIAPAPPLISRFTRPPHWGQISMAASDIFWRFSN
jgi:hypothetical protein